MKTPDDTSERRQHQALREACQDLLDHIRAVARDAPAMSETEREYAQQRLEWLADEVWRTVANLDSPGP